MNNSYDGIFIGPDDLEESDINTYGYDTPNPTHSAIDVSQCGGGNSPPKKSEYPKRTRRKISKTELGNDPQYKILKTVRLKSRQDREERNEKILKQKRIKKISRNMRQGEQSCSEKGDQNSSGGGIKKEFRQTCMICLYEFQSECNYNTDQLRHQQVFGDMEQPVACPVCQQGYCNFHFFLSQFYGS